VEFERTDKYHSITEPKSGSDRVHSPTLQPTTKSVLLRLEWCRTNLASTTQLQSEGVQSRAFQPICFLTT
jgi:hypothetical protein